MSYISWCGNRHHIWLYFFFSINLFILIGDYLLYNIVLFLPYIDMNLPWVYMCSPSLTPDYIS